MSLAEMRDLTKVGGRVLAWLILFALDIVQMQAQHYAFQVYSEENGLQNLNIQFLLQDHNGFIWAGTQNGLYRYEGLHFTAFGRNEGLTDTMISCLHETADGVLWVATRSGLFEFDGQRFRPAVDARSWEIRWQFGMASDRQNRLFVATNHGLLIGEPPATPRGSRKFNFYSNSALPPALLSGELVSSVHVDKRGAVWFSYGTKLCRLQQGTLKVLGPAEGLPDQAWKAILDDRDGNVWLRSAGHVFVSDSQSGRFVKRETGMPAGEARNYLALDEQGRILLPTNHGLGRWTPAGWQFMTKANGLPGDSVCCVLTDREGSRWIGMRGTGLIRSRSFTQWESWGREEGLLSEEVWAIERASNGGLWVGTSSGLERLPVRSKGSSISGEHSIISSFARGKDGRLWAGTAGGHVLQINERTGSVRRFGAEAGLFGTGALSVLSLMIDSSGHLWASTTEGLFQADATAHHPRFSHVQLPSRSSREMFHQCVQDRSGAVWAAGQEGLARWKNRNWTRFGSAEGLLDPHITGIAAQPGGDLWISYAKKPGVSRLSFEDNGKLRVQHLSRANGLHSDQIMAVVVDRRGWVWLTGENGVDVLQGSGWQYFGRTQGLVWNDCNSNAFYEDTDGTVWIGTSRGLAHWLAPSDSLPRPAPPVLITAALWGPHSLLNPSKPSNVYDFERQSLLISFTGLTFENESAVQFRYRLRNTDRGKFLGRDQQGIEPDWVETSSRDVRFPALQAGSFTFEVLARSADRISSKCPARLQFTILPPWWQTWWFRSLELGAILFAIRKLWIAETRQLMQRQRELEQAVAERTKELDAERKKFQELATWDSVTGVWNRRAIFELLSNELARAKRSKGTVAVIMADLDRFKQVNDKYGHQAGDAVLKEAALRMKGAVRVSDGLGRYGGEEFLIVLPECDRAAAVRRAEEIRESIARTPISTQAGELAVTCSMGVNWTREHCYDPTWLIKEADAALYRAKHAGRNRVETALDEVTLAGHEVGEPA
jgi:diguanylate cyclase (GGDEF)-like protein